MSKDDTRDNRSPEEIEADIDRTRSHLDETLSDLEQRIDPQEWVHDAYDYVSHGGANEFVSNLGRTIKHNPVPCVLLGVGLGWLMYSSSAKRKSSRHDSSRNLPVPMSQTVPGAAGGIPHGSSVADHPSTVTHPGTNDYVRASERADANTGPGIDVAAGTRSHNTPQGASGERDYPGIATHLGTRGQADTRPRPLASGMAGTGRAEPLTAESNLPASDMGGYQQSRHGNQRGRMDAVKGRLGAAKGRMGDTTSKWGDKLRGTRGQAQGLAGGMRDKARQRQEEMKARKERKQHQRKGARFSMNNMSQRTQGAKGQMASFVHEHPLVVGALGIALGAALGGMLPSTRAEDRTMGAKRDQAMNKASEAGQQQVEKARAEAMEKAADAGQQQVDSVRAKADQAKQNTETNDSSDQQTNGRNA
ncbi:DUF3618 domain-containing protein [Halomonas sp. WWR20]